MSNADKRSVHTDALETLGTIIGKGEARDAIHLAVEPAVAAERLLANDDVGFVEGGVGRRAAKLVGKVDPFLTEPVEQGQRFWLVVYPRQITSLRHVWTHPDFAEAGDASVPNDPAAEARRWIERFAESIPLAYETIMDGAAEWLADRRAGGYGEYLCFGSLLEGESVPDEFWRHYEVVTGESVADEHRGSFFTCSC